MKTYNFTTNTLNNGTDYSEILNNIIFDTVIKNNPYLMETEKKTKEDNLIDAMFDKIGSSYTFKCKSLKDDDKFIKACDFLANYGKDKNSFKIPYKLNTIYRLTDGTPIIFYDDEIQIGTDLYPYSSFNDTDFISALAPEKKKIIIDINIKL
jgi:hypothetical protein